MDGSWFTEHVVYPAIAAVVGGAGGSIGGYFVAALRFGDRVRSVEKTLDTHTGVEHTTLKSEIDGVVRAVAEMRKSLEHRDERSTQADLRKEAEEAQQIQEDRERWEHVHRTLGMIEGYLGIERRNPPRPEPRKR